MTKLVQVTVENIDELYSEVFEYIAEVNEHRGWGFEALSDAAHIEFETRYGVSPDDVY
jgi:hypothetical protein